MKIKIEGINQKYDEFVNKVNARTFFHSTKFTKFLENLLGMKSKIIFCEENHEIKGVFPFFEKTGKYGKVINSNPFFGSYGGVISNNKDVEKNLIQEFNRYTNGEGILSSVIIENPFNKIEAYREYFDYNLTDKRFTQCTVLNERTQEEVFQSFEKRVRWSIKKGLKNNIRVTIENTDPKHFERFYELHMNSIKKKGGNIKPEIFFAELLKNFQSSNDFDIFVAWKEETPIAYVLVFYYNGFSEYYMPAYDPDYLNLQSTTLLIWESIQKSITKKMNYYNFGGTWKSQKSLYLFKRGWNASEFHYDYFVKCDLEKINKISLEDLKKEYNYFYICPYDQLKNDKNN